MGHSCPIEPDETGLRKAKRSNGPRSRAYMVLRLLEAVLLGAGAALLAVYAAAQVDAAGGREHAINAFAEARRLQIAAGSLSDSSASASLVQIEYSSDPDQSLWGKGRIAA